MGIETVIHDDVLEIILQGQFSITDVITAVNQALSHPDLACPTHLLIDATDALTLESAGELQRLANNLAAAPDRIGKVAIHVSQQVRFGLARMLGAYLDNLNVHCRPFYKREEALAWIRNASPA